MRDKQPYLFSVLVLLSIAAFFACTPFSGPPDRPFHAKVYKLNDELDFEKPLAAEDFAGAAYEGGVMVAAADKRWVGAWNFQMGVPLWWAEGEGGLTAPPAIFDGAVYLGFRDSHLQKLDLKSGELLWKSKLDSFPARAMKKVGSALLVVTATQALYSLDVQTGKTNWVYDAGFPEGLTIRQTSAPLVHDRVAYYGLASGEVAAISLDSGKQVWRENIGFRSGPFHDVIGDLVIVDGRLLVTRFDGLVAAVSLNDPKSSEKGWEEPKSLSSVSCTAFRQGKLYLGSVNGYVAAFNAQTGAEIWHTLLAKSGISSITAGESHIYVSTFDGGVFSLQSQDGTMLWHDDLAGQIVGPPLYVENELYFMTGVRTLYGYKIK